MCPGLRGENGAALAPCVCASFGIISTSASASARAGRPRRARMVCPLRFVVALASVALLLYSASVLLLDTEAGEALARRFSRADRSWPRFLAAFFPGELIYNFYGKDAEGDPLPPAAAPAAAGGEEPAAAAAAAAAEAAADDGNCRGAASSGGGGGGGCEEAAAALSAAVEGAAAALHQRAAAAVT